MSPRPSPVSQTGVLRLKVTPPVSSLDWSPQTWMLPPLSYIHSQVFVQKKVFIQKMRSPPGLPPCSARPLLRVPQVGGTERYCSLKRQEDIKEGPSGRNTSDVSGQMLQKATQTHVMFFRDEACPGDVEGWVWLWLEPTPASVTRPPNSQPVHKVPFPPEQSWALSLRQQPE